MCDPYLNLCPNIMWSAHWWSGKKKIQNVKFNWVIFMFLWLQLKPFLMILYFLSWCFHKFPGFFCPIFYYVLSVLSFVCPHHHLFILKRSIVSLVKYTLKCLRIENCNFGGKLIWNRNKRVSFISRNRSVLSLGKLLSLQIWPASQVLAHFGCCSKVYLPYLCPSACLSHPPHPNLSLPSFFSFSYFLSLLTQKFCMISLNNLLQFRGTQMTVIHDIFNSDDLMLLSNKYS